MSRPLAERLGRAAPALGLLALAAAAYHDLAFWDPRSHGYPAVVGWLFEASDSSPQVIFGVVAALLWARRDALHEAYGGAPAPWSGALCIALGAACQLWALWVDAPDFGVVSLGLVGLGAGFWLGGRPLARAVAPPLALLVLALPIPGVLHNAVVFPFQLASARFTETMLDALGYAVTRSAGMLVVDGHEFEVIETCSGMRSTLTLGLLASAWAAYFRCSLVHGALLIASAAPIAFLTNGIRVMVLVLDTRPEVHESHVTQGVVMFLVGTFALSGVDRLLIRLLAKRPAADDTAGAPAGPAHHWPGARWLGATLALLAAAAFAMPGLRLREPVIGVASVVPRVLGGWRARPGPELGHYLGNTFFWKRSNLVFQQGPREVAVFLGWDDRRLRTRSLLSDKNAVPGPGWAVEERDWITLEPGGIRAERVLARRFSDWSLSIFFYHDVDGWSEELIRQALALDQPGSPFARGTRAGMLRLSAEIGREREAAAGAEAGLREFYAELAPKLVW